MLQNECNTNACRVDRHGSSTVARGTEFLGCSTSRPGHRAGRSLGTQRESCGQRPLRPSSSSQRQALPPTGAAGGDSRGADGLGPTPRKPPTHSFFDEYFAFR